MTNASSVSYYFKQYHQKIALTIRVNSYHIGNILVVSDPYILKSSDLNRFIAEIVILVFLYTELVKWKRRLSNPTLPIEIK